MLKLVKYLKKSILPILLIVMLLVVQAICDLSLPDFTAKIVDIGIQKGGIEDAVPAYIRQSEMEKLFLFMREEDQQTVKSAYTLLDKESLSEKEADRLRRKVPAIETQAVYELKKITKDEREDVYKRQVILCCKQRKKGGNRWARTYILTEPS